jgi:hypothetical protein
MLNKCIFGVFFVVITAMTTIAVNASDGSNTKNSVDGVHKMLEKHELVGKSCCADEFGNCISCFIDRRNF